MKNEQEIRVTKTRSTKDKRLKSSYTIGRRGERTVAAEGVTAR